MKITDYLDRINYNGALAPSLEVLRALQKAHIIHIPFENLDIHYNNQINLDIDKIYHKVISQKRGGFCYELNGLFHTLLNKIGFNAHIISGRVYDHKKQTFGKEFDHLIILVSLNQKKYLVDVGFGEFVFYPLELTLDKIQTDPRGDFIIEKAHPPYYKVSQKKKTVQYIFTLQKRELHDFSEMCIYHQTDTNSNFTQKKLITRPHESGRVTLSGNMLKITEKDTVIQTMTFLPETFGKYLKDWFGIDEAALIRE
ncbi:acetyltransferase [Aquimarina sp. TRL1]|uniref:arylamine N-acetyltransferase family protein n=1 Tax=Aquimarina sp. (strain TRL1) TaxID=2736252 RepID=UPI00158F354F|nr:arylamine N-acetyltransferase [Aquimarina sp. TRL1]QKX06095.1 acetyltransferase [Aquimarina sp. TRL1]